MSLVAVVTPIYKSEINLDERISLDSFRKYLKNYDHFAVMPDGLAGESTSYFNTNKIIRFPREYFFSIEGYNRLLISSRFYRAFANYKFILIAQLDALVIKDELEFWCDKGFDYIGAPWSDRYRTNGGSNFEKVGNGGFSLRKVISALRVLDKKVSQQPDYTIGYPPRWWYWKRVKKVMLFLGSMRCFLPHVSVEKFLRRHYHFNEDIFWGVHAKQLDPEFCVADVSNALKFAFESNPRGSFEKNGCKLPFGCHAWARYDREFWEEMGTLTPQPQS
jgi:hypothetical protein